MKNNNKFFKTATVITIMTLFSKMLGFVRELTIAYYFGTSSTVDMYVMAVNMPTIMLGFLTCIGTAYTPIYTEIDYKTGRKKAVGFTNVLIIAALIICVLFILLGILGSDIIVKLMAPGFTGQMLSTTSYYLIISLWNVPVLTILNILICYLQCNGKFTSASICMLMHSSIQIVFVIAAGNNSPVFLVWGYLAGNIMYFLMIYIVSAKNKYSVNTIYFDRRYAMNLGKLLLPVFLCSMLTQINSYVDKFFASTLMEGTIAALNYANTIRTFMVMMLNTGLTTILYPTLSKYIVQNEIKKIQHTVWVSIRYSIIVFMPVTAGVIISANSIVRLMFGRGSFDEQSITMTTIALVMYVISITAVGIRDIMMNFFYAVKNSKFIFAVSTLTIVINIVFNLLLVRYLKIAGLALGTSLSVLVSMPLYFNKLKKYIGEAKKDDISVTFLVKIIVSTSIMTVILCGLGNLPLPNIFIKLTLQVIIGIIVYFGLCIILKVNELLLLIKELKKS